MSYLGNLIKTPRNWRMQHFASLILFLLRAGLLHSVPAKDQLNVTVTEDEDAILTCNPTVPHFLFGSPCELRYYAQVLPRNITIFCKEDKHSQHLTIAYRLPVNFNFEDIDTDFGFGIDFGNVLTQSTGDLAGRSSITTDGVLTIYRVNSDDESTYACIKTAGNGLYLAGRTRLKVISRGEPSDPANVNSKSNGGLTAGLIAGIVLATVLVLVLVSMLVCVKLGKCSWLRPNEIEMTRNPGYNVDNQETRLSERPLPSTPQVQDPEYLQPTDYVQPYYSTVAPYDFY